MASDKINALWAGMFFILATAMGVLNAGMVGPLIGDASYLTDIADNESTVRLSVLLNTIMAGAVVAIAVALYPVLRRSHDALAAGYLAARTFEGIILAIGGLVWLVLIPVSADFVQAGSPDTAQFQLLGDTLVTLSVSIFTLGAEIVFGVTALILNVIFLRTKLVPWFISLWGLLGGALLLSLGVMKTLGLPVDAIEIAFTAPIALNEIVLALWLIIKGFSEKTQCLETSVNRSSSSSS